GGDRLTIAHLCRDPDRPRLPPTPPTDVLLSIATGGRASSPGGGCDGRSPGCESRLRRRCRSTHRESASATIAVFRCARSAPGRDAPTAARPRARNPRAGRAPARCPRVRDRTLLPPEDPPWPPDAASISPVPFFERSQGLGTGKRRSRAALDLGVAPLDFSGPRLLHRRIGVETGDEPFDQLSPLGRRKLQGGRLNRFENRRHGNSCFWSALAETMPRAAQPIKPDRNSDQADRRGGGQGRDGAAGQERGLDSTPKA